MATKEYRSSGGRMATTSDSWRFGVHGVAPYPGRI